MVRLAEVQDHVAAMMKSNDYRLDLVPEWSAAAALVAADAEGNEVLEALLL